MENQLQFQRKLTALLERAQSQGMRITKEEIGEHFADSGLNEEQMLLVYDYLFSKKIVVAGYMETAGAKAADEVQYSQEEMEYLQNYERDLKAMKAEMPGEREALFAEAAAGDALAKSRLIELYLPVVLEIAKRMHRSGLYIGDLVQEGNVSLLLALDMLADQAGSADAFLREEIRLGIRAMQEEQEELSRRDRKIEQRVNDLDEALHRAADEMGRAVTLDELAEYVQMSKEEVLDIIKLAGEDLYEKFNDSAKE